MRSFFSLTALAAALSLLAACANEVKIADQRPSNPVQPVSTAARPATPAAPMAATPASLPAAQVTVAQPVGLSRIAVVSRNRRMQETITGTIARADSMAPVYPIAIAIAAINDGVVDAYFDHDSPVGFPDVKANTMRITGTKAADGTLIFKVYGKDLTVSPDGKINWEVVGMKVVGVGVTKKSIADS